MLTAIFIARHMYRKTASARSLILQIRTLLEETPGKHILLGDFNIHTGFGELEVLLYNSDLVLLNQEGVPTFRFHNRQLPLDLCICSKSIAGRSTLKIIYQPYSDHDALLLTLNGT
jgi:endonuclease/exonuclease/phosphatase family metal-dependent hydrolase